MSQQLVKKGANGRIVKVNPRSWIEAIKDKNTGQTLVEILQGFNMYFLPYDGNTSATRCLVPTMLRKKGLWITYVKYDGNVYTEWYAADELDDKSWGDSSNWRIGNNTLVGDITISANGNWVINGTETEFKAVGEKGNTPLIRVANNRLQVSYDLGDTYIDVTNNPVYTKFRWLGTTGDTQANNVGRIQASTDEGKTWTNMSNDFTNNLHIKKYIGVNESLPTSGIAEGTIYAKGPYYAEDDTLNDNPIYRLWVYAWKGNTLAWQDNGEFQSIAAGVVQETGDSETKVMSQKAVSEKLSELGSEVVELNRTVYKKSKDIAIPEKVIEGFYPRRDTMSLQSSSDTITGVYDMNVQKVLYIDYSSINTAYFCIAFSDDMNFENKFSEIVEYENVQGSIVVASKYKYAAIALSMSAIDRNIVYSSIDGFTELKDNDKLLEDKINEVGNELYEYFKNEPDSIVEGKYIRYDLKSFYDAGDAVTGIYNIDGVSVVKIIYKNIVTDYFCVAFSNDISFSSIAKVEGYKSDNGEMYVKNSIGYKYMAVLNTYGGIVRNEVYYPKKWSEVVDEVSKALNANIEKIDNSISVKGLELNVFNSIKGKYIRADLGTWSTDSSAITNIYDLTELDKIFVEFDNIVLQYFSIAYSNDSTFSKIEKVEYYPSERGSLVINVKSKGYKYIALLGLYGGVQRNIAYEADNAAAVMNKINESNSLYGKTVWTIGDSISSANKWQEEFVRASGCKWSGELNNDALAPLSYGGSTSSPSEDVGGQARLLNLVSLRESHNVDVVIFENINDRAYYFTNKIGNIDDKPFMRLNKVRHNTTETLTSFEIAKQYATSNFDKIVGSVDNSLRVKGTMIAIPYSGVSVSGSKVSFSGEVKSESDIIIVKGGVSYSIHAMVGMTAKEIAAEFAKYSFGAGWRDIDNGDGSITIVYYTSTSERVTSVNTGDSGITATIVDSVYMGEYCIYYMGCGSGDFTNRDFWNLDDSLSLYSIYKGMIEYAVSIFPDARIVFMQPWAASVDFSSEEYKNGDGSWSQQKWKDSDYNVSLLTMFDVQKKICEFYNIECVEVYKNEGMNIHNVEYYFYSNNVHPKDVGYKQHGAVACRLMK